MHDLYTRCRYCYILYFIFEIQKTKKKNSDNFYNNQSGVSFSSSWLFSFYYIFFFILYVNVNVNVQLILIIYQWYGSVSIDRDRLQHPFYLFLLYVIKKLFIYIYFIGSVMLLFFWKSKLILVNISIFSSMKYTFFSS